MPLRLFRRNGIIGHVASHGCVVGHAKNSCALTREAASTSTSSLVLYIANEARHVAVSPKRASNGITQWVPARTATPARSMMVATSCGCAPLISKETIGPLSGAFPMMRSELIAPSRSCAYFTSAPLSLIHIYEPTRLGMISYAVF